MAVTGVTDDRNDPRLTRGVDDTPRPQAQVYLVLSAAERAAGFVEPVRATYYHARCGRPTSMSRAIAETYARNPEFYGATYCATCAMHRPVGADGEFVWAGADGRPTDQRVGTRRA